MYSLIAAFSSDTTYSVLGIASLTFMFSFRLAISLKKMIYKQNKIEKLKLITEWIFALRDIYELNHRQSMPFACWFIKTNFLEAISKRTIAPILSWKYFRLSIGVIVLSEVFTLAGSQNWKQATWMPKRSLYTCMTTCMNHEATAWLYIWPIKTN